MTQSIDIDGQQLIAHCEPKRDDAARSLLNTLAKTHRTGAALRPGSRIDFGWSILQIEAHPQHWVVCEPQYGSDPLTWQPQVDETLWVLQQQAALQAVLSGVRAQRTRGDQWLLVQPDALTAAQVYLHRSVGTNAQDSGWYIGVEKDANAEAIYPAKPMIAGLLLQLKPAWLSVLALPAEFLVHFKLDRLLDVYDEKQACIYSAE